MTDEKRRRHVERYRRYEKIRIERGKCDADVVRATGIQHATFSAWKRGDYTPGFSKIVKIADYLGCQVLAFERDEPQAVKSETEERMENALILLAILFTDAERQLAKCREVIESLQKGGDSN